MSWGRSDEDTPLDEDRARWWGNIGYLRVDGPRVDLVYRDEEGRDHIYYAAERTLLERLVPRRSTLRSDRRPGNRAASASRSPFSSRASERNARSMHRPVCGILSGCL